MRRNRRCPPSRFLPCYSVEAVDRVDQRVAAAVSDAADRWLDPIAGTGGSALRYSSLATFDLRLFVNLGQRFDRSPWTRNLRLSVSLGNIFNARQRVRDASGATPQIYQPAFLDAYGRTIGITLRKML